MVVLILMEDEEHHHNIHHDDAETNTHHRPLTRFDPSEAIFEKTEFESFEGVKSGLFQ